MVAGSSVVFPPPYRGQYDKVPLAVLQNPYCEILDNFIPEQGGTFLRKGNDRWAYVTGGDVSNLATYGTAALFAFYFSVNTVYWLDVTAGGAGTVVYSLVGSENDVQTLYFNGVLYYFGANDLAVGGALGPRQYNGTAWAAVTYTWPSAFNPFGGCVHKRRAYFIDRGKPRYAYSNTDAITGATSLVDLSSVINNSAPLYIIRSMSLTENITAQNVATFIFANGDVLAYSGAYPDSNDWSEVARFKISRPLYQNSFVDVKGDTILFTDTEVLSLRNLFVSGYSKERSEGIGAAIKNRYQQIVDVIKANSASNVAKTITGIYDEANDRLIIKFPHYVSRSGVFTPTAVLSLIYDFTLDAWFEVYQNDSTGTALIPVVARAGVYFNGYVYTTLVGSSNNTGIMRNQSATDYLDDSRSSGGSATGITYNLTTAPLSVPKFGVSQLNGVEIIMRSDQYANTQVQFIADLGRQESGAQTIENQGTDIAKPMANVGITNASLVQLEISGTSTSAASEIGIELYAFNAWHNSGEKGSR